MNNFSAPIENNKEISSYNQIMQVSLEEEQINSKAAQRHIKVTHALEALSTLYNQIHFSLEGNNSAGISYGEYISGLLLDSLGQMVILSKTYSDEAFENRHSIAIQEIQKAADSFAKLIENPEYKNIHNELKDIHDILIADETLLSEKAFTEEQKVKSILSQISGIRIVH